MELIFHTSYWPNKLLIIVSDMYHIIPHDDHAQLAMIENDGWDMNMNHIEGHT